MSYVFRRLLDAQDIAAYAHECERRIGVTYPGEYLERSHIYGFFDPTGVMVGGALMCGDGPFRAIEGIPEPERSRIVATLPKSVFEGSGLWLDRSVREPLACFSYYFGMWRAAMRMHRRYGLFTYSTKVRALADIYGLGSPPVLYEGPVFCDGMTAPDEERVCMTSLRAGTALFLLSPFVAPAWFIRRMLRRQFTQRAPVLAR